MHGEVKQSAAEPLFHAQTDYSGGTRLNPHVPSSFELESVVVVIVTLIISSMPCRALSSVSGVANLACPVVEANMSMLPVPMQVTLDPSYYGYEVRVNSKGRCMF